MNRHEDVAAQDHETVYEKSRIVEFSFVIPFGGTSADTCEEMIREHITLSLLNSLSEIHPDILCSIHTRKQEAIRRAERNDVVPPPGPDRIIQRGPLPPIGSPRWFKGMRFAVQRRRRDR